MWQGNLSLQTNAAHSFFIDFSFDAFGVGSSSSSPTEPLGYGAQWGCYTDRETGLVLMGFRYYDPGTGRFLNRDPIGQAGGVNLYSYTANNPVVNADPEGLILNYIAGAVASVAFGYGIAVLTGDPCYGWEDALRDAATGAWRRHNQQGG